MKYFIILALMVAAPFISYAQNDTLVSYSAIIEAPGVSQSDLFTRGRQWFNEFFRNSKYVIQIADKETGEIAGKGAMRITAYYLEYSKLGNVFISNFSINIYVKNGRYKYVLKEFSITYDDGTVLFSPLTSSETTNVKAFLTSNKRMQSAYTAIREANDKKVKELIESLTNAMQNANPNDF
ncbi:MAG: DUF4468 domain-containing protein [Chitinophagaceae bacterium]|nr:DUF4468 domain-containing protein [Chitinophagaceae bacterium]